MWITILQQTHFLGRYLLGSIISNASNIEKQTEPIEIIGVRALDIKGNTRKIGIINKKAYPVNLVFIDIGCMISQRMLPHLNELYYEADKLGVKFYGINKDSKAEEILKKGLVKHPNNADLNQELASGGRIVKKILN